MGGKKWHFHWPARDFDVTNRNKYYEEAATGVGAGVALGAAAAAAKRAFRAANFAASSPAEGAGVGVFEVVAAVVVVVVVVVVAKRAFRAASFSASAAGVADTAETAAPVPNLAARAASTSGARPRLGFLPFPSIKGGPNRLARSAALSVTTGM